MRRARKNPQLMFEPFTLEALEEETIQYIRDHEPVNGYQVGFSGGKDSIVTLDLVRRSGVTFVANCSLVPGNDDPSVLRFIKANYPNVNIVNAAGKGMNFFKAIEKKGLPFRKSRWCCALFKETIGKNVIIGVRAEESAKRASRPRTDSMGKRMLYKPIFHWKEWAVWEYIAKYNLPYPSQYDLGSKRLGCIVCPFAIGNSKPSAKRILESMSQHPTVWMATKRAAEKYFAKKERKTSFEVFWRGYLVGFEKNVKFEDLYPDGTPI